MLKVPKGTFGTRFRRAQRGEKFFSTFGTFFGQKSAKSSKRNFWELGTYLNQIWSKVPRPAPMDPYDASIHTGMTLI